MVLESIEAVNTGSLGERPRPFLQQGQNVARVRFAQIGQALRVMRRIDEHLMAPPAPEG